MFHSLAYLAVWATVFAIPWEVVVVVHGVGTISRIIGLLAFGLGVVGVLARGKMRAPIRFHLLTVAFLVWASLSFFWAIDPEPAMLQIKRNLQLIGLIWLLWEFSETPARRAGLYQAYVLGAYVAVINTFINYKSGVAAAGERFSAAEGANPNDLGFLLVLALPLAWHLAVTGKSFWMIWINRLYLPLGLVGLFLTASRSGLIVGIVALSIVPWTLPRLKFRVKVAAVLIAAIAVAGALAYVPARSWQRLGTTRAQLEEGTLNKRTTIWMAGLRVFPRNPIIGVGLNGYPRATQGVLGEHKGAHNAYMSVLIELGLIGIILFLAVLADTFLAARAAPLQERKLLLVLFFTLVIGLMPRAWETKKPTWVILALLHAATVPAAARARQVWAADPVRRVPLGRPYAAPRAV